MRKLFVLCCMGIVVFVGYASASTIDQVSPYIPNTTYFNMDSDVFTWQQQVTVGIAGQLVGLDLFPAASIFGDNSYTGQLDFFLNIGSGWQTDPNDYESSITIDYSDLTQWYFIDLSPAGLNFNVGDQFMIGIAGKNGGISLEGTNGDFYAPGGLYVNGSNSLDISGEEWDMAFRTYVDEGPMVPEPTSLLLLSSGLGMIGIAAWRRRK